MIAARPGRPKPKVTFTHGTLPSYVDPNQLPYAHKPFSRVLSQKWSHTVDIIVPEELSDRVSNALNEIPKYARYESTLAGIMEGEFLDRFVRSGNFSMLSEGRAGLDNVYSLHDGVLRLELPKETYERAGLTGQPILDGGRKHIKTRYAVEINLLLPSMVRGRKGFDRVHRAFKQVLNEPVAWLLSNRDGSLPDGALTRQCSLTSQMQKVARPKLEESNEEELLEWLGMVALQSPRVSSNDSIDPFLSRYQIQDAGNENVVLFQLRGFLQATWVQQTLLHLLSTNGDANARNHTSWFALSAFPFREEATDAQNGYTILRLPSSSQSVSKQAEYLMWEMQGTVET